MRKWKVGTISMGILLIVVGIILIVSQIKGINGAAMIMKWWPLVLITLGFEILLSVYYFKDKEAAFVIDGFSIFIILLLVLVSCGIFAAESFIKSEVGSAFIEQSGIYRETAVFEKNFNWKAANIKTLKISSYGEMKISPSDNDNIEIKAVVSIDNNNGEKAKELFQKLFEVIEGDKLSISTIEKSALESAREIQNVRITYYIKVPEEVLLNIDSRDAQVTIKDIDSSINVDLDYGNVEYISNKIINKDKIFSIASGNVDIKLAENQSGVFNASCAKGEILTTGFDNVSETLSKTFNYSSGNKKPFIKAHADQGNINIAKIR